MSEKIEHITQVQIGDRAVFAHPEAGCDYDKGMNDRHLVEGKTYIISNIEVRSCISYVWLKWIAIGSGPVRFNSIHFDFYRGEE